MDVLEASLLAQARSGDGAAFAELVTRHRQLLWSVCYRITLDRFDAEDALQDCLLAAWHHLPGFRGEAAVSTWLYRIAANAALAIARRRTPEPTEDLHVDPTPDLAERVVDREVVQGALRRLPPNFRAVLVLRELCDFSYEQIAEHEHIPVQTVKSRLNRARAQLKDALQSAAS